MSATPTWNKTKQYEEMRDEGLAETVKIKLEDVIAQGMIKKRLIINEKVEEFKSEDSIDTQTLVLEAAPNSTTKYQSIGTYSNPEQ
jgi:hypothetical protein